MLTRILEPEVMDTEAEAVDYDRMDHADVNRRFVHDLLEAAGASGLDLVPTVPLNGRIRVLDVGTGTAQIPIALCQDGANVTVVAADLARHMLRVAAENLGRAGLCGQVELALVDAKALPYSDGAFAVVMSNSIVHHIPEPLVVLREMQRVLAPGGVLFVRDLLRPCDLSEVDHLVSQYAGEANAHQQAMFRDSLRAALSLGELKDLLQTLGIGAHCLHQTSDRHWTLHWQRPAVGDR